MFFLCLEYPAIPEQEEVVSDYEAPTNECIFVVF